MRKEHQGTFQADSKEPVIERIAQLARKHSSRSAAARAWDINISTLNSYFKNKESLPMPRENLLQRIAESEGVSLEWLKFGTSESPKSPDLLGETEDSKSDDDLASMLSFLTRTERQQLAVMLARKGVDTMIHVLMELAALTPSELERVVRLAQQIKEGAAGDNQGGDIIDPTQQKAG